MIEWMKSRLLALIIGLAALLGIASGGGIALAQAHTIAGPGQQSASTTSLVSVQNHEDHEIQGTIQSIDNTAFTFVLLPDGKAQTITIAFDHNTRIEQENGQLGNGSYVLVEVIQRTGGVLYATEIKLVDQIQQGQNPDDKNGDNDVNDDHGNDSGGHRHHQGGDDNGKHDQGQDG